MKISVVIIAKNAEKEIADCLKSVRQLADEILVIDDCSEDNTTSIAKKMGAKVYVHKMRNFADQREFVLRQAQGEWVFYLDADERVTKELREEIIKVISYNLHAKHSPSSEVARRDSSDGGTAKKIVAYKILRKNFYFGKYEWPKIEKIERLFLKKALKGWKGAIHESPIVKGKIGELSNFLLHYTHQDLSSMVKKTNEWSEIESQMLFESGHPQMTWWRFLRVMLTKFWQSYISQNGWKLGPPGLIESIYQAFSYFIIYTKLWEKQKDENRNL